MEKFTPEGYVDLIKAAHILRIHYGTVRKFIKQQRLPAKIFFGKYLIRVTDLEKFAANYDPRPSHYAKKPWRQIEQTLREVFPEGIEL